jgi:hypothetical protein
MAHHALQMPPSLFEIKFPPLIIETTKPFRKPIPAFPVVCGP